MITDNRHASSGAGDLLWFFLVLNFGLKLPLIALNPAEYTDGILQLTVFDGPGRHAGLYPPLFGGLAWLVSGGARWMSLEVAGRVVSAIAGTQALVPIWWTTRRLAGQSAARWAGVFFTLSPMVLRWSGRAMTDSLYFALSALGVYLSWSAWCRIDEREPARADRLLAGAVLVALLAVLTRYQGVLLLGVVAVPILCFIARFRKVPIATIGAGVCWVLLPLWMWWAGFTHSGQFSGRTASSPGQTALAYWNLAESFALIAPYYFGYPVVLFAVFGLLRRDQIESNHTGEEFVERSRFIAVYSLYGVALLGLQCAFQSFQYRYMMPLLPGVLVFAGIGCAHGDRLFGSQKQSLPRTAFVAVLALSLAYLAIFSTAVLILQRNVYADQREAADYIRTEVAPETPVYSNERYGERIALGSVKLSFWSGRRIETLNEQASWPPGALKMRRLPAGAVVVLSNAYGGDANLRETMGQLQHDYALTQIRGPFRTEIVPLLDDVMVEPMYNQNPLAWVLRYQRQPFSTGIFRVGAAREAAVSFP